VQTRGVGVSDVAARHTVEITAADVSGTEPGPTHSSAAKMPHTSAAEMRATEMRSMTSEVAATATTSAAAMTARHARISSEN
jgi:hypothetical protein